MAVLGDSVCVIALEVLMQARSVLLEMRVGHGECVAQPVLGQLETVHQSLSLYLYVCHGSRRT